MSALYGSMAGERGHEQRGPRMTTNDALADAPDLFRERQPRRDYGNVLAKELLAILSERGVWMTRADLAAHGLAPRLCRLARQHSGGAIIAGQRGYRATSSATVEEIHAAASALRGQADAMLAEVRELWRVINRRDIAAPNAGGEA